MPEMLTEQLLREIRDSIQGMPDRLIQRMERSRGPDLFDYTERHPSRSERERSEPFAKDEQQKPWYHPQSQAGSQISAIENAGFALGRFMPEVSELASFSANVRNLFNAFDKLKGTPNTAEEQGQSEFERQRSALKGRDVSTDLPVVMMEAVLPEVYELKPDVAKPVEEPIPLAEAPIRDAYNLAEEPEPLQPARPEPPKGWKEEYLDLKPDAGLRKAQDAAIEQGLTPDEASAIGRAVADYILANSDAPETVYKRELLRGSEAGLDDDENLRLAREASDAARERRQAREEEAETRLPLAPDLPSENEREPLYRESPWLRPDAPDVPEGETATVGGETADDDSPVIQLLERIDGHEEKIVRLLERIDRTLKERESDSDEDNTTDSTKEKPRKSAWEHEKGERTEKHQEKPREKSKPPGPELQVEESFIEKMTNAITLGLLKGKGGKK